MNGESDSVIWKVTHMACSWAFKDVEMATNVKSLRNFKNKLGIVVCGVKRSLRVSQWGRRNDYLSKM